MKKNTLIFFIGAVIAVLGYRYFNKSKSGTGMAPAGAESLTADTKGTMILPDANKDVVINESFVAVKEAPVASMLEATIVPLFTVLNERPASLPSMIVVTYNGAMIPVGNNYYLGQGDKLEGTVSGSKFIVNRIMTMQSVNIAGLVVNMSDVIL